MKLISWNVNGIRACYPRGLANLISSSGADILCLQEIKAAPHQCEDLKISQNFSRFWYSAERKGYAGTGLLSRPDPLDIHYGTGQPAHDQEGRVLTAEYPDFYLVNVYTPNSKRALERLDYRSQNWDPHFLRYLKQLEQTKPVVCCGDFNVAHKEIDLARPKNNRRNAGFTDEERQGFDAYIQSGFIDTFRVFEKEGGHYTWWSYMNQSRPRNIGWRIDYFLISPALKPRLKEAFILPHIQGSDHCPVGITLE